MTSLLEAGMTSPRVPPPIDIASSRHTPDRHGTSLEQSYGALLTQMAQGSEAALRDFYRAFESRIYAFAKIRLNDSHEAADLLNDIMWEIWRSAGKFEGRSSVSTWVFGIAHHKVIDYLRRIGKHPMEPLESTIVEQSDSNLDEILLQKQLGKHLHHCMAKLTPDHRQTVHLAFFEDLTYREIGEITGSPEGTIKARMFHAKQALKRCLQGRL